MKTLLGFGTLSIVVMGLALGGARADLASWNQARAKATVASALLAENLHHMR